MTNNKIYISGPITGFNLEERKCFFAQMAELAESIGFTAVNPFDNGLGPDADYAAHMLADIKMLIECKAILMLPDWDLSYGAKLELNVAVACHMETYKVVTEWDKDDYTIQPLLPKEIIDSLSS